MRRLTAGLLFLAAAYLVLILAVSLLLPLRLSELTQALVSLNTSWASIFKGVAAIPDAAPIGYLLQLPFTLLSHHSPLLLRLPSILSALANCYLVWRLARRVPVRVPLAPTIVLMLLPIQFQAATDSRPFELALFFLLLSTAQLLTLVASPGYLNAALYALFLTLCIYTEPAAYLPAIGYAVFLLRFSGRRSERRALWFILPATLLPPFLFLPYYAWARTQPAAKLLFDKPPFHNTRLITQIVHSLAPGTIVTAGGGILFALLLIGFSTGLASSLKPFLWPLKMRLHLFCLAGGSIVVFAAAISVAAGFKVPLIPQQLLFGAPGLIILTFAALDWLMKSKPELRILASASAAGFLVVLCIPALFEFVTKPGYDLGGLVQTARHALTPDSCIVFVSEGESPYLFFLYDPGIWQQECHNFLSKRIVLASHPWVPPEQQREAELFFRGLNFEETERIHLSSGLVLVEEAR